MKVLLDECIDWRLKRHLPGHEVTSVQERGWGGKKNGELLRLASGEYDVFITVDQNLAYQQRLLSQQIAVVVLIVRANTLRQLLPLVPKLRQTLEAIQPGSFVLVE
jgi:predicted nuclease of predicted toxin-antitoxin system